MKRVRELDGLRCFAILGVLACHYRPVFNHWFDALSIGWAGVDLFFCISGFLITSILIGIRGSPHPYRTFYARRAVRIFPPYYLVFLVLVAVVLLRGTAIGGSVLAQIGLFLSAVQPHLILHTFHNLILTHSLDHVTRPLDLHVLHTPLDGLYIFWSLSIEELFYLLWAPLVLRGTRRLLQAGVILPLLLCPILRVFGHDSSYTEYTSFALRFDSLSAGACVALLFAARQRGAVTQRALHRLFAVALAVACAAFLLIVWRAGGFRGIEPRSSLIFAAWGYSMLSAAFASLVGLCVLHAGDGKWYLVFLRWRPLVFIGTISYMLYLIHIPAYLAITEAGRALGLRLETPGVGRALLSAALAILLAWFSWKFFESPLLRWKDSAFRKDPRSENAEAALLQQPSV